MKRAILWVLTLLVGTGGALAADRPDFSGEWKMIADKSIFGPAPMPASFLRKITLKDPSLVISDDQGTNGQKQVNTRTLTTDGKPSDQIIQGANVTCSATWDGDALVTTSTVPMYGLLYKEHMTLSADGKTLTSEVQVSSDQGDLSLLIVFQKQ
jgi:hypothetical protein